MKAKDFITEMPDVVDGDFDKEEQKDFSIIALNMAISNNYIGTAKNMNMYRVMVPNKEIELAGTYNDIPVFYSMAMPNQFPQNSWSQRIVWRDRNINQIKGIGPDIIAHLVGLTKFMVSDGKQYHGGDKIWKESFKRLINDSKYEIGAVDVDTKKFYPYDKSISLEDWFNTYSSYNNPEVSKYHLRYYIKKK